MSASHIRGNVSSKAQVLKQEGLRVVGWRAWGGSNGPDWESRLFLSFILPWWLLEGTQPCGAPAFLSGLGSVDRISLSSHVFFIGMALLT